MIVNQKNNLLEIGGKQYELDTYASELASKDCNKVITFLKEKVTLPRVIRMDAIKSVLNKFVKIAKDLNLSDEFEYRLNWYQSFSEYQLANFWRILAKDNANVFNEENEYVNFKQAFAKLLVINAEDINLAENDIIAWHKIDNGEGLTFAQFMEQSNAIFYDFENTFDGIDFETIRNDLRRSSTVVDIRAIASKHELNVPKRLKKEQLVNLVAEGLNRQGKFEKDTFEELNKMSAILLQHFAKQNGIKASTEMKKDDTIDYILNHLDDAKLLVWKKPFKVINLDDVEEFEFSKDYLRAVDFKDEDENEPIPTEAENEEKVIAPVIEKESKPAPKNEETVFNDLLESFGDVKSTNGISKESIAEHLKDKYGKKVTINRRNNYSSNGNVQVADTHFVAKTKKCFTYVYENNNGFVYALFKLNAESLVKAQNICKLTKSSFPKSNDDDWYGVGFNEDISQDECFNLFDVAVEGQGVTIDSVVAKAEEPKTEQVAALKNVNTNIDEDQLVKRIVEEIQKSQNNSLDDDRYKEINELYKERIDALEKLVLSLKYQPLNIDLRLGDSKLFERNEDVAPINISDIEIKESESADVVNEEAHDDKAPATNNVSLDPIVIDSSFSALTDEEKAKLVEEQMKKSETQNETLKVEKKEELTEEEAEEKKRKEELEKAVYDREISQFKRRRRNKVSKVIWTIIWIIIILFVLCFVYSVLADVVFSGDNPVIPANVSETIDKYLGYTKLFEKGKMLRGGFCDWVQGLVDKYINKAQ